MAEDESKIPFVSSIKIKGINLLPPVITPKRRVELQGYKQQAIKLEKRLQNCKALKKSLENILSMGSLTDRPQSDISFRDDYHVEALGIAEKISDNPLKTKTPRQIKLTQDIVDVTQYNSDGVKIICSDTNSATLYQGQHVISNNSNTDINTNTCHNEYKQIDLSPPINNQDNINKDSYLCLEGLNEKDSSLESDSVKTISSSLEKSPKPRLIRSNSYTLDTPSPILLAHLEQVEKNNQLSNAEDKKRLSICRNWSSLENNYVPFENSEFSSLNTVYNTNFSDHDKEELQSSTPIDKNESNFERSLSPSIKVFHTDISVQKITVNANNDVLNDANENYENSDSQLLQILKSLPDVYAKQIIELIEAQKVEKEKTVDDQNESKENSSFSVPMQNSRQSADTSRDEDVRSSIFNTNQKNDYHNQQNISFSGSEKFLGSTASLSPSQSVYLSLSCDTLRHMSNTSLRLLDFDSEDAVTSDEKSSSPKKSENEHYDVMKKHNVSRELFPQLDKSTLKSFKQEWAASVIGAHVKGYLTRRLLKTEKVQSLIETIKDALVCALQLHNSENIDESDVELHRRLINQVSAACYTFHEIFFSLPVQEQMLIISTDRQRKLEKAKRPSSAPSSRRSKSSSRSTPRQKLQHHSRSLTKV